MISLIVAHDEARIIGRDGEIPWHIGADLRRFRQLTMGHAIIMGRRTFDSLPGGRALDGRRNIVLTRDPAWSKPDVETAGSFEEALALVDGDCFVIGGQQVYSAALQSAERAYVTLVAGVHDGDRTFPKLSRGWRLIGQGPETQEAENTFRFKVYDRVR